MLVVVWIIVFIIVVMIALVAVGGVVGDLEDAATPAVLELEDAVNWIADQLPDEATARLSFGDVRQILLWHLDYFDDAGLASEYGEELGVYGEGEEPVIAAEDESVNYVVQRSVEAGSEIEAIDVVLVLDQQMHFLREIGAIGNAVR